MRTVPWRLGMTLIGAGVLAGLVAAGLTALLHLVQHVAFGYSQGTFEAGVLGASKIRRVTVLSVCGVVVGAGWYLLGRYARPVVRVRVAVRERMAMRPAATIAESVLQIVVVGLGASLGRESAPRRVSAALAQLLGQRVRLADEHVRVVMACAAGAGFGAVYGVPVAGALFTLEVLLRSRRLGHVLAAVMVAIVADTVAWIEVPRGPFYDVAVGPWSWALLVGALLAGPMAGAAGLGFDAATRWAGERRPQSWAVPATAVPVFAALGLLSLAAPSLLGNGRGPAQLAFDGGRTTLVLLSLGLAKPLVTAACLRTGATGGLITPAIATGALLGAGLGGLWHDVFASSAASGVAVVVVAGVLAVTVRAPFTAVALAFELTGPPWWLLLPIILTTIGAWMTARGWKREA